MNKLKKLRQENNVLDKKLSPENNAIITDMVCYLRSSNLCDFDLENIRKELTGIVLEAQLRGEDFNMVIGEDYRTFCDELMANGRQKTTSDNVLEMVYILISGVGVLYLIEIVFSSGLKQLIQSGQYMLPITTGFLISALLICVMAFSVYYYVTKKSFDLSQRGSNSKIVFVIGFGVAWTVIILCKVFLKNVLVTVNMFYPLVVFVLAYIVIKWLSDRHDNRYFDTIIKA